MNVGKAVYGILSANSGVTDIVGTNIFPEIAEQETAVPFIVYQLLSVDPEDTHDGPSKLDEVRFEFLCYADSYNEAADLGVAVRAALDRVSGTYNGVNVESVQFNDVDVEIEYDPRRYSQVLKFTFRIKRDDVTIALGTPVTGAVLGDLSDVDVDGVTNGQLIAYNSTSGNWEAADDAGGAETLDDLTDVDAGSPSAGQLLSYGQGEWTTIEQDELTLPISSVSGLQTELNTIPDNIDDLNDVKIVGTPAEGDALVYQSGFWSRGTAGASTLDELDDVQVPTPSSGAVLQYNGTYWAASALSIPSVPNTYYHQRYSSEAGTLRSGATETVELYYTAQADGDGLSESASSDTPTSGYDIRRKLYYAEKAQADPDTSGDWTQFADIADDTTFASAKATLLAYLKARTGGTVPISLKMTWEEVTAAPAFTGLLNESYGSGAAAAYSTRRLNGNVTDCMVIRRASDSTTTTIGFVNGDIDEAAINTFCTGTTCTVVTWKDQSGNANDATAPSTGDEPTIYTGGALVKENGKVALLGSNDYFESNSISSGSEDRSVYITYNADTVSSSNQMFDFTDVQGGSLNCWTVTTEVAVRCRNTTYVPGGGLTTRSLLSIEQDKSENPELRMYVSGTETGSGGNISETVATGSTRIMGSAQSNTYSGSFQEILIYAGANGDKSSVRTSIESNIGDYFTQNTPLLDTYTGAAAAYSLRKLRTAYTGDAVEVYNGSSYADIGFNIFGELDTVALADHCGASDGFVSKWYDQSSNTNDAAQTTTANMPKIYDGTTGVVTENGKPALEFDNSNDSFTEVTGLTYNTNDVGAFVVCRATAGHNNYATALNLGPGISSEIALPYRTERLLYCGTDQGTGTSDTTQNLVSLYADNASNDVKGYIDQTEKLNTTVVSNAKTSFEIANIRSISSSYWGGTIQEIVFYASSSKAVHTDIEDNINTFYSIY
jgi:hypothetical protein